MNALSTPNTTVNVILTGSIHNDSTFHVVTLTLSLHRIKATLIKHIIWCFPALN